MQTLYKNYKKNTVSCICNKSKYSFYNFSFLLLPFSKKSAYLMYRPDIVFYLNNETRGVVGTNLM